MVPLVALTPGEEAPAMVRACKDGIFPTQEFAHVCFTYR
jgi:hypothetical protein